MSFVVGYQKSWPNGATQEIPIPCYVTGAERIAQLGWLKEGAVVVIHGELTDKAAVYAHHLERLSKPDAHRGRTTNFSPACSGRSP